MGNGKQRGAASSAMALALFLQAAAASFVVGYLLACRYEAVTHWLYCLPTTRSQHLPKPHARIGIVDVASTPVRPGFRLYYPTDDVGAPVKMGLFAFAYAYVQLLTA